MRDVIDCLCCGEAIPVGGGQVGQAVICPRSHQLVRVEAHRVRREALPAPAAEAAAGHPDPRVRRARRLAASVGAVAVLALLAGGAGLNLREKSRNAAKTPGDVAAVEGKPAAARPAAIALGNSYPAPPAVPQPLPAASQPAPTPSPATVATPVATPAAKPAPVAPVPFVAAPAPAVVAAAPSVPPPTPRSALRVLRSEPRPLDRRIDVRSESELLRDLLSVREVSLDTPQSGQAVAADLVALAQAARQAGGAYPGPAVAARKRPDLASLPFRLGAEAVLDRERAQELQTLSLKLRALITASVAPGDPRPDPARLSAKLAGDGESSPVWTSEQAVPCVQQLLQAEPAKTRLVSVAALAENRGDSATRALASWAAFDCESAVRAAAARALVGRDRAFVRALLLEFWHHPYPRAAEHAAEALVELRDEGAISELAPLLAKPRPDRELALSLDGKPGSYRRELVRVNHARNCLLCHPPSFDPGDLVRGSVPDPARPLASSSPAYYSGGSTFVRADTSYLKQDFAVPQPVANPGAWPAHQRYDYLVAVRQVKPGSAETTGADPYQEAALFALRELSRRPGAERAQFVSAIAPTERPAAGAVAKALVQSADPMALVELGQAELTRPLLAMDATERLLALGGFRRRHGESAAGLALVAYLEPLATSGPAGARGVAGELLAAVRRSGVPQMSLAELPRAKKLLSDPRPEVRRDALDALTDQKMLSVDELTALVESDRDPQFRRRGVAALAAGPSTRIGQLTKTWRALVELLRDRDPGVRAAAAQGLVALDYAETDEAKAVAEALISRENWTGAGDERARFQAALMTIVAKLGKRTPAAITVIVAQSGTPTDLSDDSLAKLLLSGATPDASSDAALVRLMARPKLCPAAASLSAQIGPRLIPALAAALKERDAPPEARAAMADLLGRLAGADGRATTAARRQALDALVALKSGDPDPAVRAAASKALAPLTRGVGQ